VTRLSGSSVERAMQCAASIALPGAGYQGVEAEVGTENHAKIEAGDTSIDVVAEVLSGATKVRHEVAYVLDVKMRTAHCVGVNVGRNYGELGPYQMGMTIDIECVKDGVWWVVDWKSRERVTPASRNWQLRCAALALMWTKGVSHVNVAIGYLDDSDLDGPQTIDAFDAPGLWSDLLRLFERIQKLRGVETPDVNAGSWCKYCPAMPHCPAHRNLALSLLGELDIEGQIASLTPEQQGRVYEKLKLATKQLERIEETIKMLAKSAPIPLSDGRMLAAVQMPGRKSIDLDKVRDMLGGSVPYKSGKGFVQLKVINEKEAAE
jgi:hypothetical protein